MSTRRGFLGRGAAVALAARAQASRGGRGYQDIEASIARRDFRNILKDDLPTPCMIVELDTLERNLRAMAAHCRATGMKLRGHVKVHKSPEVARRQLELGAVGVTCATVAECELMARSGVPGILLTRQPTSRNNIGRTAALARRDPTFATVVDDPLVAGWLEEAAAAEKTKLRVMVDVYAGMTRHGIECGAPALELARKVDTAANLRLIGLMGYSGGASHTQGWEERRKKSEEDLSGLRETVALAGKAGLPAEIVSGGSTGTYNIDAPGQPLTELQAGSYVFMDTFYRPIGGKSDPAAFGDFGLALTVMTTVISKRHPRQCTIDAGNKAMLRPTDEVKGRPEVRVRNQGAEYGVLEWNDGDKDFKLGERVELYPTQLDMSTSVYDRYFVARGERVVDVWPIMGRAGAPQR